MSGRPPPQKRPSHKTMRGQPLLMLVAVLAGWSASRASTWTSLALEADPAAFAGELMAQARSLQTPVQVVPVNALTVPQAAPSALPAFADPTGWQPAPVPQALTQPVPLAEPALTQAAPPEAASHREQQRSKPATGVQAVPPRRAVGHALLQAAGYARLQVPPQLAAYFSGAAEPAPQPARRTQQNSSLAQPARPERQQNARTSRWSGDGWLLWRDDTTTPVTSGRPSYGRSQMGAVVRYELAPQSGRRPQAYLRASAALQGARENGVAVGLSARPLARLPVRLAGELRANQRASGTRAVPAAYAVSELPPQRLPGGLVAEAYAQGGYVGGRDATAFVDGQARIDRTVTASDDFDLRAGGALWGGAQDDGSRLDVGPSASLAFRVGASRGRVAADYRFRVAGDAEPASGPALTLSAGF